MIHIILTKRIFFGSWLRFHILILSTGTSTDYLELFKNNVMTNQRFNFNINYYTVTVDEMKLKLEQKSSPLNLTNNSHIIKKEFKELT